MIARTRGSTYDSDEVVGAGGVTVPVTSDGHASKTATHAKGKKKDGGGFGGVIGIGVDRSRL